MEYFYSCGCVLNRTEEPENAFCPTHGRRSLLCVEADIKANKVPARSKYEANKIFYDLATSLPLDLSSYGIVVFESDTNLICRMPTRPFFITGSIEEATALMLKVDLKKHVMTDAGHIHFTTEVDGKLFDNVQPYYTFNIDLSMSKYVYLGVTGLVYDYILSKLNIENVLHIGARNVFLARRCMERDIEYTAQTIKQSVYAALKSEQTLKALRITDKGQF